MPFSTRQPTISHQSKHKIWLPSVLKYNEKVNYLYTLDYSLAGTGSFRTNLCDEYHIALGGRTR